MSSDYKSSDISILSDIEHIRLRPGMYVGELIYPTQLLNEIIDNALDESQSGNNELTEVFVCTKSDDKSPVYRVRDYGRGIPIGTILYEGTEIEVLQALFMKANSGAKFNSNVYRVRSGLHGVGGVCVCALSSNFKVRTYRDGQSVTLITHQGLFQSLDYQLTSEPNGVEVEFTPDSELFETELIPQDLIISRCKIAKSMGYPIKLYINDEEVNIDIDNILQLIPNEDLSIYCEDIIKVSTDNGESLMVGFRYTNATNKKEYGYTNLLPNQYGGTHIDVVNDSIAYCWNQYARSPEFKSNDSMIGLRAVVACFIDNAAFSSQTKDKLTVPRNRLKDLYQKFEIELLKWMNKHKDLSDKLVERFSAYRRNLNSLEAQKEIMSKVKIAEINKVDNTVKRGSSVVPNLIDCQSKKRDGTELFIVEGNSAAGAVARPRDKQTQAVLPLRGKIQNISGMSLNEALKHPTVLSIANAIGCGVGEFCDSSKSRYERIIITADSDPDGAHIVALVLTSLVNLVPNIVRDGLVYVIQAPLYGWWGKDGIKHYGINFNEVNQEDFEAHRFMRYKGLGALDDDDFKNACLDISNRIMYRIDYPTDIDEFNWIAGTSEGRSELLDKYGVLIRSEV